MASSTHPPVDPDTEEDKRSVFSMSALHRRAAENASGPPSSATSTRNVPASEVSSSSSSSRAVSFFASLRLEDRTVTCACANDVGSRRGRHTGAKVSSLCLDAPT